MSEASPEWITALLGYWKLYGRHAKNGQIFIWTNACVLFHMNQLVCRRKTKTTVGDQINTVSKTNKHRTRWSKFTDENACLCITDWWIELKEFGVVCLFIIHLFLQIFPKLVVVYLCTHTLSCAPATQHKHVLSPQHNICSQAVTADGVQVTSALRFATLVAAVLGLSDMVMVMVYSVFYKPFWGVKTTT